ncbi:peptidylprolyl isomerase [Polaribacter sp. Hel1_85]|uniref:peptidylprolyl isomerase n=1 Tax=Polaribacter sp. Hel1_85 TaxID=1250005 RepID=UPI000ADC8F74|nr:peptidylprolyl isomerase [Polaribacter sp. Hel1_85]
MKIIDVTENEIVNKLYVYITEIGIPDFKDKNNPIERKSNPTEMDSIFVNRKGVQLLGNTIDYDNNLFDSADQTWWSLAPTYGLSGQAPSPIKGWIKGFPFFKSGENITNNGPITYNNTGKGYLFIPSGLGYSSINYQLGQTLNALFDKTLVFEVELLDLVENTDHDNDGKPSIKEDTDKDGDPTNDFSDTDNPNLPDYLNPDIN